MSLAGKVCNYPMILGPDDSDTLLVVKLWTENVLLMNSVQARSDMFSTGSAWMPLNILDQILCDNFLSGRECTQSMRFGQLLSGKYLVGTWRRWTLLGTSRFLASTCAPKR